MRRPLALVLAVGFAAATLAAQSATSSTSSPGAKPATAAAKPATGWKAPRTPDGHPDFQGVWSNNSVTPMQRPAQWKDKSELTDAEVKELQGLVAQSIKDGGDAEFGSLVQIALNLKDSGKYNQRSYDPTTGNYNQFWMVDRDWDNRTSLIMDPKNGMMPALTPDAQARRARGRGLPAVVVEGSETGPRGRADGPEDRPLSERCISYGAPRTSTGYNSYMQIVQSPETVVILQEMIHDARLVPMDGQPHLPQAVRQLHGDPRGHWEGDTLVVETTNFINGFQGSTPNVKVTERYVRENQDYLDWYLTVNDPDTWVQPWTYMVRLKHTDDQIYEYACHEGNRSMVGILAGARNEEKQAAEAAAAKK
jgi:hypothetical protein